MPTVGAATGRPEKPHGTLGDVARSANEFEAIVEMIDRWWFETDRLAARRWSMKDAQAAFAIYGHPDVTRFLDQPFESVEEIRRRLERIVARDVALADRGMGSWALAEKETGQLVGSVLLKPLPDTEEIEVGWHLRRDAWGRGYATEAGRAMCDYGFDTLGLEVIHAVIDQQNRRSRGVADRLGMRCLGATDRFYQRTLDLFSLTAGRRCWISGGATPKA